MWDVPRQAVTLACGTLLLTMHVLCCAVSQALLPWVTGSFSAEEKEAMMESLREATKNTMFDQWLDAVQGSSTKGSDTATTPRHQQQQQQQQPAGAAAGGQAAGSSQQQQMMMDAHMQLAEIAGYLTNEDTPCAAAAAAAGGRTHGGTPGHLLAAPQQQQQQQLHQGAQALLQQQTEVSGTVAESTNYMPGWEDIFNINQKQLEGAIRRVSNDPNLEPQRKAYLIQNIMVSRYIVAQQRNMRSEGSLDAAGRAGLDAAAAAAGAGHGQHAAAAGGSCHHHHHHGHSHHGHCGAHHHQQQHMHNGCQHQQQYGGVVHQQQLLQAQPVQPDSSGCAAGAVATTPNAAGAAAAAAAGGAGGGPAAAAAAGDVCHQTYTDATSGILGCQHYRRAARLVAPCCNQVFTCRCVPAYTAYFRLHASILNYLLVAMSVAMSFACMCCHLPCVLRYVSCRDVP
jgi:zinc finger-like protein